VVGVAAALGAPTIFGLNVGLFALLINAATAFGTNAALPSRR